MSNETKVKSISLKAFFITLAIIIVILVGVDIWLDKTYGFNNKAIATFCDIFGIPYDDSMYIDKGPVQYTIILRRTERGSDYVRNHKAELVFDEKINLVSYNTDDIIPDLQMLALKNDIVTRTFKDIQSLILYINTNSSCRAALKE